MTRPPRMRPVFDLPLTGSGESAFAAIRAALGKPDCDLDGQVLDQHAYLRLPSHRDSLLSPNLNLELREENGVTILHCRFTPKPSVWTGFMGLFFFIGMLGLGGLIYGLAQLTVDGPRWPMLAAPVALALIAFIYGAAFIGQGLSGEEMFELRSFVERALRDDELRNED
jgi:hypothetical protein